MEITIYNSSENRTQIQLFNTYLSTNYIKYNVVNNKNIRNTGYLYYSVYTQDENIFDFDILDMLQKLNI